MLKEWGKVSTNDGTQYHGFLDHCIIAVGAHLRPLSSLWQWFYAFS